MTAFVDDRTMQTEMTPVDGAGNFSSAVVILRTVCKAFSRIIVFAQIWSPGMPHLSVFFNASRWTPNSVFASLRTWSLPWHDEALLDVHFPFLHQIVNGFFYAVLDTGTAFK